MCPILRIPYSHVTDEGLLAIAHCTSLKKLDLTGADVTDEAILKLHSLLGLEVLNLAGTKITAATLRAIVENHALRELDISATNVRGEDLEVLRGFPHLETLVIDPKQLRGGMGHVKQLQNLKRLAILGRREEPDSATNEELEALRQALPGAEVNRSRY